MKSFINRKIFFILLGLSLLSVFAVFPYIITLQGVLLKQTGLPIFVIFFAQLLQSAILFSITIFIGLSLVKKISFHLPLLEALVTHQDYRSILKDILPISVLLGFFTALVIFLTDYIFSSQGAAISTSQTLAPIWQTLLAALYGELLKKS